MAFVVAAFVCLAGVGVAAAFLHADGIHGGRQVAFAVALAPGVGCGIASLLYFFAALSIGRPGRVGFVAALLTVCALAAGAAMLRSRRRLGRPRTAVPRRRPALSASLVALCWAALAVSGFVAGRMLLHIAFAWPEGTWDAVAIWNVRARFLFHGAEEMAEHLGAVAPSSHPHYPLLLPGAVAAQWAIAGAELEWTSRMVALGFTLGLILLVFAAAADTRSWVAGALAAALVGGTPLLWVWGASQVADVVVSYLFLGAVTVLASQLDGYPAPPLPPALGGLLLGLLAFTKNEGWLMAAILGGLLALAWTFECLFTERRRLARTAMPVAAGALPGIAALLVFKRSWAPHGTGIDTFLQGAWQDRLADPARWWLPARSILGRLFEAGEATSSWFYIWPALIAGAVGVLVLHRGRPGAWFVFWGAAVGAVIASWVPIYAFTPYDQAWHIGSSLDRLLLQVMPASATGVVMGAVAARRPREAGSLREPTEEGSSPT